MGSIETMPIIKIVHTSCRIEGNEVGKTTFVQSADSVYLFMYFPELFARLPFAARPTRVATAAAGHSLGNVQTESLRS